MVDDITLQWRGSINKGGIPLTCAASETMRCLQDRLHFRVSKQKSFITSTSSELGRAVGRGLRFWRLGLSPWVRNLGADEGGTKLRRVMPLRRIAACARKVKRCISLRAAAGAWKVRRLVRGSLHSSWRYGTSVHGRNNRELWLQRRHTANALGISSAGCRSLVFALELDVAIDPVVDATCLPALAYARSIWAGLVRLSDLACVWRWAVAALDASKRPWGTVRGPVMVTILTLRRIGWNMEDPLTFCTHNGESLVLTKVAPNDIKQHLLEGVADWQWKRSANKIVGWAERYGNERAWLTPIRSLLRSRWESPRHRGAVRAIASAAGWPAARLRLFGYDTPGACEVCGHAAGWSTHRWWQCAGALRGAAGGAAVPVTSPAGGGVHADALASPPFFAPASAAELPDPLLEYGLRPPPAFLAARPAAAENELLFEGDQNLPWRGKFYIDGSGLEPQLPELRRCGWAVVMCDDHGNLLRAVYGPLPGCWQDVGRAELFALVMLAICVGAAMADVATDCIAVFTGWGLGPATSSQRSAMGTLWRRLQFELLRVDGVSLQVRKVKAHTGAAAVKSGLISAADQAGNEHADRLAKLGALRHAFTPAEAAAFRKQNEQVQSILKHAALTLVSQCSVSLAALPKPRLPTPGQPRVAEALIVHLHVIEPCLLRGHSWCTRCRRIAKGPEALDALLEQPCVPFSDRVLASVPAASSHRLMR